MLKQIRFNHYVFVLDNRLLQLFSQINFGMWSKEVDEDCSCLLRDTIAIGKCTEQDIIKKCHGKLRAL